ncbi:UNVERIFIED_CONTAM: hypothetical protein Sindi_2689500 [Sesamum indicum]
MSSSSNSNSKSHPGSGSSTSSSESASGSTSRSMFGSASRSTSRSSHGSFSTSPKRNKKFPISKLADEHAGPSTLAKFQDRLAKNPWEAVVSNVRMPVLKIWEKYHIPSDYDIIIPATFDRMHRPPEGFSAFSIKHLDVGLRFPLVPPIASILNKLGLCPMQLSPNSITHIVFFVVIMQFLDSIIMSLRNTLWMKAAANKVVKAKAKGKQVAPAKDLPTKDLPPKDLPPAPIPPRARVPASPTNRQPIPVDSEETPSQPLLRYNSSDLELNLDTISGDQGGKVEEKKAVLAKTRAGEASKGKELVDPSSSSKSKSQRPKTLSKMAREAVDKSSQEGERDRFLRLEQLTLHWEETREFGDATPLRWDSASSTVLFAEAGGEPFDLYNSMTSLRDQSSMVTNNPVRIEQYGAHAMLQGLTFLRSLSLKCKSYRKNYIMTDRKVKELQAQLAERDNQELKHADELLAYAEKIKHLEGQLDVAKKEKEIALSERDVALAEGKKEGFDTGREAGLAEVHTRGFEEGQSGRITLGEHQKLLAGSRMAAIRDFLKTDTFTTGLELKSTDSFAKGYKTCEFQIEKLGGFQESFDRSQLDITLDGDLQPYPPDPELKDDEFMALRAELEAEAEDKDDDGDAA